MRLCLIKEAPLSPFLFLVYINDLLQFCARPSDSRFMIILIVKANLTMTADDLLVHTTSWVYLRIWLDACSSWSCRTKMGWESSKCTVICISDEEVERNDLVLYIGGCKINKVKNTSYLGMTLTSNGLRDEPNLQLRTTVLKKASALAEAGSKGKEFRGGCF